MRTIICLVCNELLHSEELHANHPHDPIKRWDDSSCQWEEAVILNEDGSKSLLTQYRSLTIPGSDWVRKEKCMECDSEYCQCEELAARNSE